MAEQASSVATRLYDYTYMDWRSLAHRNNPGWTEQQFDASWDEHIQFPVRATKTEVTHGPA
jgi:hypothetical protein